MAKRRFINFTKEELEIMQNSISEKKLQNEIKEEFKIREFNQRSYKEWAKNRPKAYVC